MVTSADGGAEAPREGYYPDPSIPGYVRYWNGTAWVPGTSRPQPGPGEELPPPPGGRAPAPEARPVPPQASAAREPAARPAPVSFDESGAMFLDEDPAAPVAQPGPHVAGPAPAPAAWAPAPQSAQPPQSPAPQQPEPRPVRPPQSQAAHTAAPQAPHEGGYGYPRTAPPATPSAPAGYGYPERQLPAAPGGYGYPPAGPAVAPQQPAPHPASGGGGVPWQRQVSELARQDGPGLPGADTPEVVPWRPLASDPFAQAAQPAKPGGNGRRLAARVLDTLLVGAVVSAATYPLAMGSLHHIQHKIDAARLSGENVQVWLIDGTTGTYLGVVLAAMLLAGLLYEVLPTVKWGRTLGKKLFRLQVLDIESQATPGFGQALRRMLLRQVLDFLVVGAVNVAWCLFDRPWRQCWHDKVARTFVAADN